MYCKYIKTFISLKKRMGPQTVTVKVLSIMFNSYHGNQMVVDASVPLDRDLEEVD